MQINELLRLSLCSVRNPHESDNLALRYRQIQQAIARADARLALVVPDLRNRTAPEIEEAIVRLAFEQPPFGWVRVSNELRKQGHQISPAGGTANTRRGSGRLRMRPAAPPPACA